MVVIGNMNTLQIIKKVDFGVYLDAESLGEILLPNNALPEGYDIDDYIDVFIYCDSDDELIATTTKPLAKVGELAKLKVVAVNEVGAFMEWGLPKQLLVPFKEQLTPMQEGKSYWVYLYRENYTVRLAATSKYEKFMDLQEPKYTMGQMVDLLPYKETDLGFKAVINNRHIGLIFKADIFKPIKMGERLKGYIKTIRKDKKINLTLQKPGYDISDELKDKIIDLLRQNNGFIALTDRTSPEQIYKIFGVSKKKYKNALGSLYKNKQIMIKENGVYTRND